MKSPLEELMSAHRESDESEIYEHYDNTLGLMGVEGVLPWMVGALAVALLYLNKDDTLSIPEENYSPTISPLPSHEYAPQSYLSIPSTIQKQYVKTLFKEQSPVSTTSSKKLTTEISPLVAAGGKYSKPYIAPRGGPSTISGGDMKEQYFGSLEDALDRDYAARIKSYGPNRIEIHESDLIGDYLQCSDACVDFGPSRTVVNDLTTTYTPAMTASQSPDLVPSAVASQAQSSSASSIAATAQAAAFTPVTQSAFVASLYAAPDPATAAASAAIPSTGPTASPTDIASQLLQQGEQAMPDLTSTASSALTSTEQLVSSVSPNLAQTIQQKFAALTPGQQVAAGLSVYIAGKAALSFIPMKYLLLAGALYVWNQMQQSQAAAAAAPNAATTTPVHGMG